MEADANDEVFKWVLEGNLAGFIGGAFLRSGRPQAPGAGQTSKTQPPKNPARLPIGTQQVEADANDEIFKREEPPRRPREFRICFARAVIRRSQGQLCVCERTTSHDFCGP